MAECIEPGCKKDLRSTSGLTGGSAYKMRRIAESGTSLTGSFLSGAVPRTGCFRTDASVGRIVAAPTAGSCGISTSAASDHAGRKNILEGIVSCPCLQPLPFRHGHCQRIPGRRPGRMSGRGGWQLCGSHGGHCHCGAGRRHSPWRDMPSPLPSRTFLDLYATQCSQLGGNTMYPSTNASRWQEPLWQPNWRWPKAKRHPCGYEVIWTMKRFETPCPRPLGEQQKAGLPPLQPEGVSTSKVFGTARSQAGAADAVVCILGCLKIH